MKLCVSALILHIILATKAVSGGSLLPAFTPIPSPPTNSIAPSPTTSPTALLPSQPPTTEATMPHHSGVMDFVPLLCNHALDATPCKMWSQHFGMDSIHTALITIPCGSCIEMDYPGDLLVFEQGIDIQGKLVFPESNSSKALTIQTPHVIVQGELHMHATNKAVDGHFAYKLELIGDNDTQLQPIDNNDGVCQEARKCNVGKKVIAVAGGKINGKNTTGCLHACI